MPSTYRNCLKKTTPVSKGADINSGKQKSSNLVNVKRCVTCSLQSIAQNTSTDSAKNKCKNTQPVKYIKSVLELKVLMPKTKECVSLKQSLEISCDMCDIKFPSFAHLGEHIMKESQKKLRLLLFTM